MSKKPGPKEAAQAAFREQRDAHVVAHAATLAPKGECAYCDARREMARAGMARQRRKRKWPNAPPSE